MAYTNVWTDNTPVGGDSSTNLAADLKRLKLDISERMNSIIPNWDNGDPLSVVPTASAIEFAKSYIYNGALANPATLATIVRSCLIIDMEGLTDVLGRIFLNFQAGEFDEDWDLSAASLIGIVASAWWNDDINDFCFPFVDFAITATVITFSPKDQDGSNMVSANVRGRVLLFFGTIALPTLTSIVPNTGVQGANVNVTLTGTNFVGTEVQINVSGTLVVVANIVIVSTVQITAQFQINIAAALGVRTVSVTTVGGTSNTQNFTVT